MNKAKIKSNLVSFGVAILVALVICAAVVAVHFLTPQSSASAETDSISVGTVYEFQRTIGGTSGAVFPSGDVNLQSVNGTHYFSIYIDNILITIPYYSGFGDNNFGLVTVTHKNTAFNVGSGAITGVNYYYQFQGGNGGNVYMYFNSSNVFLGVQLNFNTSLGNNSSLPAPGFYTASNFNHSIKFVFSNYVASTNYPQFDNWLKRFFSVSSLDPFGFAYEGTRYSLYNVVDSTATSAWLQNFTFLTKKSNTLCLDVSNDNVVSTYSFDISRDNTVLFMPIHVTESSSLTFYYDGYSETTLEGTINTLDLAYRMWANTLAISDIFYQSGMQEVTEDIGYEQGYTDQNNLISLVWYTFELPFKLMFGTYDNNPESATYGRYVGGLFNFEFLGLDIRAFVLSVMSVCIIIAIVKLILGSRGGSNG